MISSSLKMSTVVWQKAGSYVRMNFVFSSTRLRPLRICGRWPHSQKRMPFWLPIDRVLKGLTGKLWSNITVHRGGCGPGAKREHL